MAGVPAPPPGFVLNTAPPAPPPGFVMDAASKSAPPPAVSGAQSFGSGAVDTLSLGFADEIATGINNLAYQVGLPTPKGYSPDGELERQRAMQIAEQAAHPALYGAGQFAGFVPSALVPAGVAARGTSSVMRVARGAGAGAAQGAAYGAGSANGDMADRASGAALGLGTGAVAGAVAVPVAGALGRIASGIANGVTHRGTDRATRHIAGLADADALDAALLQSMGPTAMLADAGPNLTQRAASIAASPGPGQAIVRDALRNRQALAGPRLRADTDAVLGRRPNIPQTAEQIAADRARASAPLYQQAYATQIHVSPAIQSIVQTPAGRAAMARASRIAADEGAPIDPANLDTRALDYLKRGLDDLASGYQRSGANQQFRAVAGLRQALLNDLDHQNPAYAAARQAYAGPSSVLDALEAGRTMFSRSVPPDELRATLGSMSAGESQAFRQGARDQVEEIMGTARNDAGAAIRELAEKGWNREKLALLVGGPDAQRLISAMERERRFAGTAQSVTGNSESARRIAGIIDQNGGGALGRLQSGFVNGGVLGALRAAGIGGIRAAAAGASDADLQRAAAEIGRRLVATGPERDAILTALQQISSGRPLVTSVGERTGRLSEGVVRSAGVLGGNAGSNLLFNSP